MSIDAVTLSLPDLLPLLPPAVSRSTQGGSPFAVTVCHVEQGHLCIARWSPTHGFASTSLTDEVADVPGSLPSSVDPLSLASPLSLSSSLISVPALTLG